MAILKDDNETYIKNTDIFCLELYSDIEENDEGKFKQVIKTLKRYDNDEQYLFARGVCEQAQ